MKHLLLRYSIAICISGIIFLSACSSVSPPEQILADDFYPQSASKISPAKPHTPPEMVTDALIPDFNQTILPIKPAPISFNISVNEVNAREFFMGLVIDTDINMLVHPEVSGKIALELKNVTMVQALDAVQKVYGYDYQKSDFGYIIYPATLQTKIFKINHLDMVRQGKSQTRVSSGQISSPNNNQSGTNNSVGNSATNNNKNTSISGSSINTFSETNFWSELHYSLEAIVAASENGSVVINQHTGVLVVRAKPMQMREVEKFIAETQIQIKKQVIIEAKILEVILNDSHQSGINWANIAQQGAKLFFSSGASLALDGAAALIASATPDIPSIFTLAVQSGDFTAFVTLLETQGEN